MENNNTEGKRMDTNKEKTKKRFMVFLFVRY